MIAARVPRNQAAAADETKPTGATGASVSGALSTCRRHPSPHWNSAGVTTGSVATSPLGRPIGFALMKLKADTAWLDQLSVLDRWQRHGHGAALIDRTARQARTLGFDTLYLSTYRDVPWNAPFYTRRGFSVVPRGHWPRALRVQFLLENSHGHPPWWRVIMQRSLGGDR
jgi:GNAT superfamily N-acetyltransferase